MQGEEVPYVQLENGARIYFMEKGYAYEPLRGSEVHQMLTLELSEDRATPEMDELQRMYLHIDQVYTERNLCVVGLCHLALALGYIAGKIVGPCEFADATEDWNLVLIDFPSGQVSWHIHESEMHYFDFLPLYEHRYDGHTLIEKYERVLTCLTPPYAVFPDSLSWSKRQFMHTRLAETFHTLPVPVVDDEEQEKVVQDG